jgi:plasmid stabilization system protein ParE
LRLRYTLRAAVELADVLDYIAARSPQGARRVQERIRVMTSLLLQHPYAGTQTSRSRLRRVVAHPFPYLIFYEISGEDIIIHGVRHTARNPRTMPE